MFIIGGLGVLVLFALVELLIEEPLVQVRIFASRAFVVDNVVLFLSMIAFVPAFFFASVYSQVSLGYDANKAGSLPAGVLRRFRSRCPGRRPDARQARVPVDR